MKWKKLGKVFCPEKVHPWMWSHAANPVAELLENRQCRIYFGTRDEAKRTSIGFVEFAIDRPQQIKRIADTPAIGPGQLGTFDDSGTSMGCLTIRGSERRLYYVGWNLAVTVPWRNSIGLAVSERAPAPFQKVSLAPIVDRSQVDPFSMSYPWVLFDEGRWRMWYGSNLGWGTRQEDMRHVIKYAESADGIRWERTGHVAIGPNDASEYAIARPCVVRDRDRYRMWYAYRGDKYRIGYAESADGVAWRRLDDQAGIDVSPGEWDGESVCYPSVFDAGRDRFLLYNGNGYGATGFGLAVLERD